MPLPELFFRKMCKKTSGISFCFSYISYELTTCGRWKLVHGEVFRGPKWVITLSILVGNGAQMIGMFGVTLSICFLYASLYVC